MEKANFEKLCVQANSYTKDNKIMFFDDSADIALTMGQFLLEFKDYWETRSPMEKASFIETIEGDYEKSPLLDQTTALIANAINLIE